MIKLQPPHHPLSHVPIGSNLPFVYSLTPEEPDVACPKSALAEAIGVVGVVSAGVEVDRLTLGNGGGSTSTSIVRQGTPTEYTNDINEIDGAISGVYSVSD